jgi:alpha-L-glutamate ligase-related protein
MAKWTWPRKLADAGVLGMNGRNHRYIARYNPRRLYPLVDDKTKTKELAKRHGINVTDLIGSIRYQHEVAVLKDMVKNHPDFVIKPAHGSGGRGIVVIVNHNGDVYEKADGQKLSFADLYRHVSTILSGLYSIGGQVDTALVEERIKFTAVFDGYSFEGVPDVRQIVFKGYPVMSMIRLSTRASDGKANLHKGAVGVGLSLRTGTALHAVRHGQPLVLHPDTKNDLSQLAVPLWDEHLRLAVACHRVCGLGYFGADIALDRERGPLLLELNARPGLAIQIANRAGLLPRLQRIEQLPPDAHPTDEEKIAFSQAHFP